MVLPCPRFAHFPKSARRFQNGKTLGAITHLAQMFGIPIALVDIGMNGADALKFISECQDDYVQDWSVRFGFPRHLGAIDPSSEN